MVFVRSVDIERPPAMAIEKSESRSSNPFYDIYLGMESFFHVSAHTNHYQPTANLICKGITAPGESSGNLLFFMAVQYGDRVIALHDTGSIIFMYRYYCYVREPINLQRIIKYGSNQLNTIFLDDIEYVLAN